MRAAVAIADADGLGAVTFRTVATRLGTGVMSLYSYVPDKQTLVYDMVEHVSGELELPVPTGDWRADLRLLAHRQRALLHRHTWLIGALSHLQPLGPALLAVLEFALAALEPTGLPPAACLETFSLLNGFVANLVRAEITGREAAAAGSADAAAQQARLGALLATGRYPRFAAALAAGGPPATDLTGHFDRLFDRIMDGLVRPDGSTPPAPAGSTAEPPAGSTAEPPAGSTAEPPAGSTAEPPATNTPEPPAGSTPEPPAGSTPEPPAGGTPEPPATNTPEPPAGSTPEPPAGGTPEPGAG